jgi:hypothetical protein
VQKLIYAIIGFVVLLIVIGLALPRYGRVIVSTDIDAPAATVFAQLNDFHRVQLWSPLSDTDPNARIVYSGPKRGQGATMTWDGAIIGTGAQTITESRPFERVATLINNGEARTWFDLSAQTGTTTVSWGFETDYGYNVAGRYIALLLNNVIRQEHTEAISGLKSLAESLPGADFGDLEIEHLVTEAQDIAYLPTTSAPEPAAISEAMGKAYFEILTYIDRRGLEETGAPMSVTRSFDGSALLFDAAIPVRGAPEESAGETGSVRIGKTWAGPVVRVKHIGSYRTLGTTHNKISAYLAALGIERAGAAWESYVSDPTKVAETDLVTYIYYPIRL